MLPAVYCVTSLFCVTLVSDKNPVIQQQEIQAKDLSFVNDVIRNNFKYFDAQVHQNIIYRLNKLASGIVANVTFDLLSELSEEVDIVTNGHWATSPCFVNVSTDMAERVKAILPEMTDCVKDLHKKYRSLKQQTKEALAACAQNEMTVKNLSLKCDSLPNVEDCYTQYVMLVRESVFQHTMMFQQANDNLEEIVTKELPGAEACLNSFSTRIEEAAGPVRGASRACQGAVLDQKQH
ncbi:hypothetical protein KM043_018612 [Ampulex compressa]|uniref:Venom protein n=1 Tax=Ampulex compressa TaxID=860918 RepID=A0A1W6EVX5_AMPCP|nr:venom protein [Ampulex compressa]KAG7202278.1 hypothetical protein KM043_018612 [Ampulex compressa]